VHGFIRAGAQRLRLLGRQFSIYHGHNQLLKLKSFNKNVLTKRFL
jgi:hypothetical protein